MIKQTRGLRHEGTFFAIVMVSALACSPSEQQSRQTAQSDSARAADSAFQAVQARGRGVMGVDQYTSAHVFEDLPDGGRIILDRAEASDTAAVATIRAHMREIAGQFKAGDFAAPGLVHAQQVPGTEVMAARASTLTYTASDRPRGAEVRIQSKDSVAVRAVHDFLAFQRSDHRSSGHEGHASHPASPPAEPPARSP